MTTSCMRMVAFDTAHRLIDHEGKCRNLHGHRYVAEIHARSPALDSLGRVVDFSVLKSRIGGWVDKHWDHTAVLHRADPLAKALAAHFAQDGHQLAKPAYIVDFNPTAENLAHHLLHHVAKVAMLGCDSCIEIFKVVLHETPNCSATVELSP